jgi:hypothetical protein
MVPPGYKAETFASGIAGPTALAFGPGGDFGENLFVVSRPAECILKIDPCGNVSTFACSPLLNGAHDAAFDLTGSFGGDLYLSADIVCPSGFPGSCNSGGIVRVTPTGAVSLFADAFATSPGLFGAAGIAFSPAGTLHIGDFETDFSGIGNVLRLDPGGFLTPIVPNGAAKGAFGIAFDSNGNFGGDMFVVDTNLDGIFLNGTNTILRVTPTGGVSSFASSPLFVNPFWIALDTVGFFGGDLFVSDPGAQAVFRVDPSGTVTPFATGFAGNWSLTFDSRGSLYVADRGSDCIIKISRPVLMIEILAGIVVDMNLKGVGRSLMANLDTAVKKLEDGNEKNDRVACNALQTFRIKAEAQRGEKLTDAQADELVGGATEILESLGCVCE